MNDGCLDLIARTYLLKLWRFVGEFIQVEDTCGCTRMYVGEREGWLALQSINSPLPSLLERVPGWMHAIGTPLLCHPRKPLYILVAMFYNPSEDTLELVRQPEGLLLISTISNSSSQVNSHNRCYILIQIFSFLSLLSCQEEMYKRGAWRQERSYCPGVEKEFLDLGEPGLYSKSHFHQEGIPTG